MEGKTKHLILSNTEWKMFVLLNFLMNKADRSATLEEIKQHTGIPETSISYYLEKIYNVVEEVGNNEEIKIYKIGPFLHLEAKSPVSVNILRKNYIANSFFMYFLQELYHHRFSNLMKAADERYISYDTAKRELVKCKNYFSVYDLSLFPKKRVENMLEGSEVQIRYMYFCTVLTQFGFDSKRFFERKNVSLENFLGNFQGKIPTSSYMKLEIFYQICLDRAKAGKLLGADFHLPHLFDDHCVDKQEFFHQAKCLFAGFRLTEEELRKECEFLHFIFYTLVFEPLGNVREPEKMENYTEFEIYTQTLERYFETKLTKKERFFAYFMLNKCLAWCETFHVNFAFPSLTLEKRRIEELNPKKMYLWEKTITSLKQEKSLGKFFQHNQNLEFFLLRICNTIFFHRKERCKVFFLTYSTTFQYTAMEKLQERFLNLSLEFTTNIEEADVIITSVDLPKQRIKTPFVCWINVPFDTNDWQHIEKMFNAFSERRYGLDE
ncbi:Mga helix-turn-helix domain-containing protein [Pilibacter termitis]|uniref:Mga helix-turn-helix domain-containing protein n=1 Tax=Pilibacter termitis TaxID=263852 RepID=A0A1T4Q0D5_9ENTE|nr:helix-turn-helix domain-containing protein [Pilibacter termitis]SJZ97036.1 Mga helix-turn-helix domain-containing protein [Pilibacter termitis]